MDLGIISALLKSGGKEKIIAEFWPYLEDLLKTVFELHRHKTEENEYLVFNLTEKRQDNTLYILPGAINVETGMFRNIEVNIDGAMTKIIPINKKMLMELIANSRKEGQKHLEEPAPQPETEDEPFQNLEL